MPLALAELLLRGTSLGLDHAEPVGFREYRTRRSIWERGLGNSMYGFQRHVGVMLAGADLQVSGYTILQAVLEMRLRTSETRPKRKYYCQETASWNTTAYYGTFSALCEVPANCREVDAP